MLTCTFMDISKASNTCMSCAECKTYWFLIYPNTDQEFDIRKYCQILCFQLFAAR